MRHIRFSVFWRQTGLASVAAMLLLFIFSVPIAAGHLSDDLTDTTPVCWYPATCYVDQTFDGHANGSASEPFAKFTVGMNVARERGQWYEVDAQVIVESGQYAATGVYTYPTTITASNGEVVLGGFPDLTGKICDWGDEDCNRCAENVEWQFENLRSHGDIMGFYMGEHPNFSWGWESFWHEHWQGIQRIAYDGGQYLVVTRDDVVFDGAGWSAFAVVKMGLRVENGLRFRSNRLQYDLPFSHSSPFLTDSILWTEKIDEREDYEHPGSPQSMGKYMIVGANHDVHLYDLSNPLQPVRIGPPDPSYQQGIGPIIKRPNMSSSSVAMVKLADDRYLVVVAGSDAKSLDYYFSKEANSFDDFWKYDRTTASDVTVEDGESFKYLWDTYQNLNLVTECNTGSIYLVATGNLDATADCSPNSIGKPCWPDGEDWASLYRLYVPEESPNDVKLRKVSEFHAYCSYRSWENSPPCDPIEPGCFKHCNFDAAAGAYIDANGKLLLYSTEHSNDGPTLFGSTNGTIKAMEFRPMPHDTCETIDKAWVELFEHESFDGQGRMIDFVDDDRKDYSEYHQVSMEYFGDEASSARWCIPDGWGYRLYEHSNYGGDTLLIQGIGQHRQIDDLADFDFGDRISSSRWVDLSDLAESTESEAIIE